MFNAKLVIVSGVGIAGAWKFWPEQLGAYPLLVALGALLVVWAFLVTTICLMDYRRRRGTTRSLPDNARDGRVARALARQAVE